MVKRLAYAQIGGVEAVTDRLQIEDQWGQGASGVITPDSFRTTSGGGLTPMSVSVGAGRGIVYSDVAFNGSYHVTSDDPTTIDLQSASSTQYRRDAIVARVRDQTLNAGDGDTSFNLEYIPGAYTSSSNPPLPALPDRSFLVSDVVVNPNATVPSLISDRRAMVKPREYFYQITITQTVTVTVNVNTYIVANHFTLPNWPFWARVGGCRLFHRCESTARVIAAGEALLRAVIGIAPGDVKVFGNPFYNRLAASGVFSYMATGEYTLPAMDAVCSQLHVVRAGTLQTALTFDAQQSVSTHTVRVFEQPT